MHLYRDSTLYELHELFSTQFHKADNSTIVPADIMYSLYCMLNHLILDYNQLTGIPAEIGNMTNLGYLDLSNNQITGSIPSEIGNLNMLSILNLDYNKLAGSIPSEIGNLTNLTKLKLNNNKLDIISAIILNALDSLWIQNNHFTFEDFEPIISVPKKFFLYSPQDSIGIRIDTTGNTGQDFTFTVSCGGTNNMYKWYKNNTLIPLATTSAYTISNLQQTDAGSYFCAVTNTVAPNLTIYSRPTSLSVSFPSDVRENEISGIRVYPNPTKGLLNIEFGNGFFIGSTLEVYDAYGRIIVHKQLEDKINHEIDL